MILLMLYRGILRILTQFLVNLSVIEKNAGLPRVYNEWVDGWFCAHIPATSSLKTHFCLLSVSGLLEKAGMIFISETRDGSLRSGKPTLLLATWNQTENSRCCWVSRGLRRDGNLWEVLSYYKSLSTVYYIVR